MGIYSTEVRKALIAELRRHGITDYTFEKGRGCNRLVFTYRGRTYKVNFSARTHHNARGIKAAVTALRRILRSKSEKGIRISRRSRGRSRQSTLPGTHL